MITDIIMIEDSEAEYVLVSEMLSEVRDVQFRVRWFTTLEEGLKHVNEDSVVLLDLGLSDSVGLDTFYRLRKAAECTTVIVTNHDDIQTALKAISDGAEDYLVKGEVSGHLLSRLIMYAIERHKKAVETKLLIRSLLDRLSSIDKTLEKL